MKRLFTLTVVLGLLLTFTACGNAPIDSTPTTTESTIVTTTTITETATEAALTETAVLTNVTAPATTTQTTEPSVETSVVSEPTTTTTTATTVIKKPSKTTKYVPTAWTTTIPTGPYIAKENAVHVALEHAKFSRSDVRELEVEFEISHGIPVYDVDFEVGNIEYGYMIHAETGAIYAYYIEDPVNSTGFGSLSQPSHKLDTITREQARDIALKHAGLTVDAVRDLEVDFDEDIVEYDVNFEAGGFEYEYDIDALTSVILRQQKEKQD